MNTLATTRMSSRGQVVIPEKVRRALGLRAGEQFVVVGRGDVVILKTLAAPDMKRFDDLVGKARRGVRKAGLSKAHVRQAIRRVRRNP